MCTEHPRVRELESPKVGESKGRRVRQWRIRELESPRVGGSKSRIGEALREIRLENFEISSSKSSESEQGTRDSSKVGVEMEFLWVNRIKLEKEEDEKRQNFAWALNQLTIQEGYWMTRSGPGHGCMSNDGETVSCQGGRVSASQDN